MNGRGWILASLLAAGCGAGPTMMTLADKTFDLVPKEDRAVLDGSKALIAQAEKALDQAKEARKQAEAERERAGEDLEYADLAARTAAARKEWTIARAEWLKKAEESAAREVDAANAQHQLDRARLAADKGLKPYEGFDARRFETQQLDYQKAFLNAQIAADKAKKTSDKAEAEYKSLQGKLDKASKDR